MDRQKRNLIILGVVVLVVIVVWIRGLTVPVVTRKQVPSSTVGQTTKEIPGAVRPQLVRVPISPLESAISEERTKSRFPYWGRDPFVLRGELVQGVKGLVLKGIVWDEATPLAMINDVVLGVGDRIGESRIIKITQTAVILEEDGREFTLRLGQEESP